MSGITCHVLDTSLGRPAAGVLVKLERMPLSRHGKIDYQRLPAPTPVEAESEAEPARSEVEKLLAGIWSEVLGLARVGREENFFELGGHSLLATQVMSRVRAVFGVEVRLRELFELYKSCHGLLLLSRSANYVQGQRMWRFVTG